MEKNEIVSRLTPIFRDVFNNDALVVSEGMTADDVPTWDSLSNINMIIAVEKGIRRQVQHQGRPQPQERRRTASN